MEEASSVLNFCFGSARLLREELMAFIFHELGVDEVRWHVIQTSIKQAMRRENSQIEL
jgi:hypothetical protein